MRRQTMKEALAAAFFDLARSKPVDRITVSEICEEAGVSRVTFYKHFADKAELANWVSVEAGKAMIAHLGPSYTWRDYLHDVCQGNSEAGGVLRNLTHNTEGYRGFAQTMYRNQLELVSAHIAKQDAAVLTPRLTLVLRVYLHGLTDELCEWIERGMPGDPIEVSDSLCDAVPEPLRPLLFL